MVKAYKMINCHFGYQGGVIPMGDDFEEKQGEIKQDKQFVNMAKKELKKDEKDLKKMKEKGNKK